MLFASVEKIEDGDQKWHGIGGIYLHGKVEDFFGYDIVAVAKDDLEELQTASKEGRDGVECQVDGYKGKTLLFVWKAEQDLFPTAEFYRGFIVDADDEEAVKHARSKFNEKAFAI
jgi:hypothetical protein